MSSLPGWVSQEPSRLATRARRALLDHAAYALSAHLNQAGFSSILLKGPAVATWLFNEGERDYVDVDLLVDPGRVEDVLRELSTLGYEDVLANAAPSEIGAGNELSLLGPNGVVIDLHHRLIGAPSSELCWSVLTQHTAELALAGGSVRVLDLDARTMHLALHAAQNGPSDAQALRDLERGLAELPADRWARAHAIARELQAEEAFAAGLRLLADGRSVAGVLHIPATMGVEIAIRSAGGSQDALFFERLRLSPGWQSRAQLVARELWPTTAFLRQASSLGARGPSAILAARARHLASLLTRVVPAVITWRRARRQSFRTTSGSSRAVDQDPT